MARALLLAVGLLAVAGFFAGQLADVGWLRLAAKPVPALCLAAWMSTLQGGPYTRRLLVGFLLSALGDALLEVSPAGFLPGLVAFLLAHVAFVGAYLSADRSPRPLRALPAYAYGAGVLAALWGGLGDMRGPVLAYVAVICTMLWRAAALLGAPGARAALGGAALFALSDTLIAVDRFHAEIPGADYPILATYWLGQLGIARSAIPRSRP